VGLSQRRREFLTALVELVEASGGPVHYSDVAREMKVSKWTAYDMMQELIAQNLAEIHYSVSPQGTPGRSQVLFAPTKAGLGIIKSQEEKAFRARWNSQAETSQAQGPEPAPDLVLAPSQGDDLRAFFDERLERLRSELTSRKKDLAGLFREMAGEKANRTPLQFCADVLLGIALELKIRQAVEFYALKSIMNLNTETGAELLLFAGILLGSTTVKGLYKKVANLERLLRRLLDDLAGLTTSTKAALLNAIKEVLSDRIPA